MADTPGDGDGVGVSRDAVWQLQSGAPSNVYDASREWERMRLLQMPCWRMLQQREYELCSSYPREVIVPTELSEKSLTKAAHFHLHERLPVVTWKNPYGESVILRSATTRSRRGTISSRSPDDEVLLETLSRCISQVGDTNQSSAPGDDGPHSAIAGSDGGGGDGRAHGGARARMFVVTERPASLSAGVAAVQSSSTAARGGLTKDDGRTFAYPHCEFIEVCGYIVSWFEMIDHGFRC